MTWGTTENGSDYSVICGDWGRNFVLVYGLETVLVEGDLWQAF